MSRPRLLDLFCGAGGAALGYHNAGFEVVGVDSKPQPYYPFEFIQADATTFPLDGFDALHGSPPCKDWNPLVALGGLHGTGWMLQHTIDRFRESGKPWVVENVAGARIPGAFILCGTQFGLGAEGRVLRRHRRFWSNVFIPAPGPCRCAGKPTGGVYGTGGGGQMTRGYKFPVHVGRRAMGIDWMTQDRLSQAIPPAYTEFIGEFLMDHLNREVAA